MKKIAALILALSTILCLAACANIKNVVKPGDNSLVGVWSTSIDFDKLMTAAVKSAESSEDAEGMQELVGAFSKMFSEVTMKTMLEFKEGGTYRLYMDEDSVKESSEKMAENLSESLPAILSALFGTTEEELTAYLEEAGMSMESMMDSFISEFKPEELAKEFSEGMNGTYRYENGRLYLTPEGEKEDASSYWEIELKSGKLTVTGVVGDEEMGEEISSILPIVFTK